MDDWNRDETEEDALRAGAFRRLQALQSAKARPALTVASTKQQKAMPAKEASVSNSAIDEAPHKIMEMMKAAMLCQAQGSSDSS